MNRVTTGAYIASAKLGVPNRKGPRYAEKHSFQMVVIRSTSACAPDQILKPRRRALRFIGNADRKLLNPECISPQMERQRARAARSFGSSPAFGFSSLRYSAIARVSQILMPLWVRHGTKMDGESRSSSARFAGSSAGTVSSAKSTPAILHSNQPRSDQEE